MLQMGEGEGDEDDGDDGERVKSYSLVAIPLDNFELLPVSSYEHFRMAAGLVSVNVGWGGRAGAFPCGSSFSGYRGTLSDITVSLWKMTFVRAQ